LTLGAGYPRTKEDPYTQYVLIDGSRPIRKLKLKPLTTAERDKLDVPDDAVIIFNSTTDQYEVRYNAAWEALHPDCNYFEQTVPLAVNSLQQLNNTAANKAFIASNTRGASGLVSTDDTKVQKVILTVIGSVVNTYSGTNAIDCTTATHNQWQVNLDGGAWADLVNGASADGQMNDNDWRLPRQGSALGFSLSFDVTSQITNIDGNIGLQLENGRSEADGFEVTTSIYLTVLWEL